MEKSTRAELIAALVTDKHSGFKEEDSSMLEACSDTRLEEFRSASDERKAAERNHAKVANELTKAEARLKVAEDRVKAAEQPPSDDEWLARAPKEIKALLDAHKQQEEDTKASLVSQLKDRGANTEAELKAMGLDQLKMLAAYARVEVPDFSGRGLPTERHASVNTGDYTPPDPYALALKAQSKAVN